MFCVVGGSVAWGYTIETYNHIISSCIIRTKTGTSISNVIRAITVWYLVTSKSCKEWKVYFYRKIINAGLWCSLRVDFYYQDAPKRLILFSSTTVKFLNNFMNKMFFKKCFYHHCCIVNSPDNLMIHLYLKSCFRLTKKKKCIIIDSVKCFVRTYQCSISGGSFGCNVFNNK